MSKMFKTVTRTWNPFTGCGFDCVYCWARDLALGKLAHTPRYSEAKFKPTFHVAELDKTFKCGVFVFITDMGDISFATWHQLHSILKVIEKYPETNFLLQTKDPGMFLNGLIWPENIYHGATIETNRKIDCSKAPHPISRYHSFAVNNNPHKFLSIEPIMDFDLEVFASWVLDINPEIVEIGADNYRHELPEPSWYKVQSLMDILEKGYIKVVEKDGLRRLALSGQ